MNPRANVSSRGESGRQGAGLRPAGMGGLSPLIACALLMLGLASPACFPSFDMEGKDACRSDFDCLRGERCDRPQRDRPGVCLREGGPVDAPSRTTPAGVVPPGASQPQTSALPGTGGGAPGGVSSGGAAVCEGFPPERFLSDPQNCGACGVSCDAPHAETACEEGACVIVACASGRADVNGRWEDGCEESCDDGEFYCRDFEDRRCDGAAAQAPGCVTPPDLRERRWRLIRWNTRAPQAEVNLGIAQVGGEPDFLRIEFLERGNAQVSGHGGVLDNEVWTLERVTRDAWEARSDGRRVRLRSAEGLGVGLLVGVERDASGEGRGILWYMLEEGAPGALEGRAQVGVIANPLAELDRAALPEIALGWTSPIQVPLFRFRAGTEFPLPVDVPWIAYRNEVAGAPESEQSLAALAWQVADGLLQIIRYPGGFNRSPDKVLDGATLPGGELVMTVPRWVRAACPGSHGRVRGDRCVPDPVLMASAPISAPEVDALEGVWRLVGWELRAASSAELGAQVVDAEFVVRGGRVYGPLFTGGVVRRVRADAPPVLEWNLAGPGSPLPEGRVLQGAVDVPSGVGLLWSRGGASSAERLNNAFYLLLRQES